MLFRKHLKTYLNTKQWQPAEPLSDVAIEIMFQITDTKTGVLEDLREADLTKTTEIWQVFGTEKVDQSTNGNKREECIKWKEQQHCHSIEGHQWSCLHSSRDKAVASSKTCRIYYYSNQLLQTTNIITLEQEFNTLQVISETICSDNLLTGAKRPAFSTNHFAITIQRT